MAQTSKNVDYSQKNEKQTSEQVVLFAETAEEKATDEHLRVLASIVESSDDAIFSKTLAGIITSWNTAAERIYGYTAEEIVGQQVTRLFPLHLQGEFPQIMARIRQGERVDHYETIRVHKNGTRLQVSVTISPIRDRTGTITGASTIARDITEHKRLADKSHQFFASNLIGIFVANDAGIVLEANQAFLDLVGYTEDEGQEKSIWQNALTASAASFLHPERLKTVQETGHAGPQESVLQQKSGQSLPVLVAMTKLQQEEGCIGFVLDISARKILEQRKDEFISMASHELKTPITSLKGFLGLLQRLQTSQTDEKVHHYLARMDAQIDKLTKLINDLLDISKIQSGHLIYREERFALDELVQEIVENVQETTQTHRLLLEGQTPVEVYGDRDRLGQILINLLNNAIKYSPQADTVVTRLAIDEHQIVVSVQDFGLGIAKMYQQKIFEQFYQVTDHEEKTYPGLGLGLYISNEIVKRHQGRLWVESQKGAGATFYLSLPLIQEKTASLYGTNKDTTPGCRIEKAHEKKSL